MHPLRTAASTSNGKRENFHPGPTGSGERPVLLVAQVYRTRQDRSIVDLLSNNSTANRSLILGLPNTSGRVPYRRTALSMNSGASGWTSSQNSAVSHAAA